MSLKAQIELVVFDLIGTTIYDGGAVNRTFRAAFTAAGLHVTREEVNRVMGLTKPQAIRLLLESVGTPGMLAPRPEKVQEQLQEEIHHCFLTSERIQEMPGTSAVFRRLHEAGIMVALNTGLDRKMAEILLARMGWGRDGLIDATITSDEVQQGRPFPDMIHRLMERLHVYGARHVVKIGDTPLDLQEGRNAGCGVVAGVTNGTHTREELLYCGADALLDSVTGLPHLLGLQDSLEYADE